jgi:RNA polymerase sigma-70 factor (ECF subfamily)
MKASPMKADASDEDLLRRMAAGDEEAFASLYRARQAAIYRYALHMTGSPDAAADVAQEVFLQLARVGRGFRPERGTVAAWLFGIARNLVLKHLARAKTLEPMPECETAGGDLLADVTRKETIDSVRQAILSLPEHYREAVVLCELEEMDYAEAAAALGCAVGTVRSRLHRARAILLDKLRPRRGVTHELSGV